jgi:hypothetical protein
VTTSIPATSFTGPVPAQRLERAAAALTARDFAVEILDDAAARARVKELIPEGASVFTGASETLRLSGIEEDINKSGRYDSLKSRPPMDRATQRNEIWAALSTPDVLVGSVAAVTETGSLVAASASGSQLPGYAGAAARVIWVVGAQKVVPDLTAGLSPSPGAAPSCCSVRPSGSETTGSHPAAYEARHPAVRWVQPMELLGYLPVRGRVRVVNSGKLS